MQHLNIFVSENFGSVSKLDILLPYRPMPKFSNVQIDDNAPAYPYGSRESSRAHKCTHNQI